MCRTLNSKEGFTKNSLCVFFLPSYPFIFIPTENCQGNYTKNKPFSKLFFCFCLRALCHRHLPVLLGALLIHVCLPMFLSSLTSVSATSFCGSHGHFHFFMRALRKTMSRIDQNGIQKPVCNFLGNKCKPYRCHMVVL